MSFGAPNSAAWPLYSVQEYGQLFTLDAPIGALALVADPGCVSWWWQFIGTDWIEFKTDHDDKDPYAVGHNVGMTHLTDFPRDAMALWVLPEGTPTCRRCKSVGKQCVTQSQST